MAAPEFVEGWLVAQVLGEGAYGEVRLLVHARTGAAVALKAARGGADGASGAREAALHRALRHPHVLRCLGERAHNGLHYMFLEYAQGGELFDRIEPDVGMGAGAARRYWRQLLAGLRYLSARGVAHRDIKPENLLLDASDTLKISDFGMATLFRHGDRERLLTRVCGTAPYAAPEVLAAAARPYRAPPADLWAAGVVLLAMRAGELPWARACADDARYAAWARWAEGGVGGPPGPARRLDAPTVRVLRRVLSPCAAARPSVARVLRDAWLAADEPPEPEEGARVWRSQPAGGAEGCGGGGCAVGAGAGDLSPADMDALLRHSQPAHTDDLLLHTQREGGAGAGSGSGAGAFGARMTRLRLRAGAAGAARALEAAAAALGYSARRLPAHPHMLVIECDQEVRMRAWVVGGGGGAAWGGGGGGGSLVEVRRWRGCGLEFKRRFLRLRHELRDLLQPDDPPPPPAPPPPRPDRMDLDE